MRLMDDAVIAGHLENLDRRLERVEQFLPTLATKEELEERLAAQTGQLRHEIRQEGERSRRHMDVLIEGQRADIQLLAEHLSVEMSKRTGTSPGGVE
jgi:hypothetical protein